MDTLVSIDVVAGPNQPDPADAIRRAMGWFAEVERRCSRFDPGSELRRLSATVGQPLPVSDLLLAALGLALQVSAATDGRFDPTVGARLVREGFDRNYLTGERTGTPDSPADLGADWRDVIVDDSARTVLLRRPLLLDLGAVAKGFAIDLAARELGEFGRFAIYAGGDILVYEAPGGAEGWRIGIRHPREEGAVIDTLHLNQGAVCTSGDYERGHHIVDSLRPLVDEIAVVSSTVVAPTAVVADALSTAALILGPRKGIRLLEQQCVQGILFDASLRRHETRGFAALRR